MLSNWRQAILAIPLAGLMCAGTSGPGHAADAGEWQIGFITATSGPLKQTGDSTAIAVEVAADEINAKGGIEGRKIHLIRYDTASDPKQASVAVRALAEDDKVLAIIGPLSSSETAVAINDAERLRILMLPYSSSAPGLTKGKTFTWRLSAGEDKQFSRLLQALKNKHVEMKTADIIYVSDDRIANITGTQVYPPLLKAAGVTITKSVTFNTNSFDVSAQIAQVMQDNPDVVALAANFDQAVVILRELHRQNYKGRVIGSQLFAEPNLVELFGHDADGMIFASGFWRGHDAATEAFAKRFVQETAARGLHKLGPHHVDAQAFDTVYLLKQAIETSHVTGDPSKLAAERVAVRDALKGIKFSGVLGPNICFTGTDAELPGYIIQVQQGQWTLFDEFPPDQCAIN
jgi:branched-chain amino acid transport system substrate-binding protein